MSIKVIKVTSFVQYQEKLREIFDTHVQEILDWEQKNKLREFENPIEYNYDKPQRVLLFRGVKDSKYKLVQKVGRNEKALTEEVSILRSFKARGSFHFSVPPKDDWDWLVIAQHYGLPTRLLDWSTSPMVAAYFSVEDVEDERNSDECAIFVLSKLKTISIHQLPHYSEGPLKLSDKVNNMVMRFAPYYQNNPRIVAQRGVFTIHPQPSLPLDDVLESHNCLQKLVIKGKDLQVHFKNTLDIIGINRETLFPDLDGLAKYIHWNYTEKVGAPLFSL